ncbi:MAG: PQQ-binding-like beta-propeller repeat protein [Verrucomicrobiota bacterium]
MRLGICLAGFAFICCFSSASGQQDWPQFRGPSAQGLAEKAPGRWDPEKDVAWRIEVVAEGWSSPVISGDTLVLTGSTGSGDDTRLHVLAFDTETGDARWKKEVISPKREELLAKHAKNSLASSTPIIRDGIIYAHFGHMGTVALQLADGEILWSKNFSYPPMHGGASSPLLVDDHLIVSADGEEDPVIFARNVETGKIVWKTARDAKVKRTFSFCTPLLIEEGGRKIVVSPASGMVGGYDPKTGEAVWKVSYEEGFSVVPRPVFMDGLVYISTSFMKPQLIAIDPKGAKGEVSKSHVKWKEKKFGPKTPSFIAHDGVLYILDDTGMVTCRDAKSGKLKWREKLIGNFSASPILAGRHLHCQTEDGVCYVMEVSPEGGKLIHEVDLEQRILASPAVVDGALYLRTESHLWKITGG